MYVKTEYGNSRRNETYVTCDVKDRRERKGFTSGLEGLFGGRVVDRRLVDGGSIIVWCGASWAIDREVRKKKKGEGI